jgi:hypothetical protein
MNKMPWNKRLSDKLTEGITIIRSVTSPAHAGFQQTNKYWLLYFIFNLKNRNHGTYQSAH